MKPSPSVLLGVASLLGLTGLALAQSKPPAPSTPQDPAKLAHFESKVRPLLLAKCLVCHGKEAPQGGVRLDQAVTPEIAQKIAQTIRYDGKIKMPPTGKLADSEIAALTQWTADGAVWPNKLALEGKKAPSGKLWSFVPITRAPLEPPVEKSGIDAFLLAKLQKNGLTMAPKTDRRTLLRRLSFDLLGLPPTPQEIDAFLADKSPNAYEKQVDRLLASPHFGERWGRHWLDVARYADSNGLDENIAHGNAWRYRDWVIDALNRDLPYDEFIRQQLAGDLMATGDDVEDARKLTATGYLTLGPKVLAEPDKQKMVMDIVDEQIDVVTKSVLGLTVACARCHDHKFDPISTKDYYALAGIFKSTRTMETLNTVAHWYERPLKSAALTAKQREFDTQLKPLQDAVAAARKAQNDALSATGAGVSVEAAAFTRGSGIAKNMYGKGTINSAGSPTVAEWDITVPKAGRYAFYLRYASNERRAVTLTAGGAVVNARAANTDTGSFQEDGQRWELAGALPLTAGPLTVKLESGGSIPHVSRVLLIPEGTLDPAVSEKAVREAEQKLKALEAKRPETPMVMAVTDNTQVEDVKVHIRGDILNLGDIVPRAFPAALCGGQRKAVVARSTSGRLELAQWMTRAENPLTARVMVNRAWLHLFGEGIVSTPDNWGVRGTLPSHPELLDYLAWNFTHSDRWSVKKLIKRIVLTDAYQQTSHAVSATASLKDPENRLLWRQNKRRLDAEPLRDTLHFVAGTLDLSVGGSLLTNRNFDYVTNDQSANAAQYDAPRRALYLPVIRNAVYDFFSTFDFGDPSMVNAKRTATTVSPQALYLLNSPLVQRQAKAFTHLLSPEPNDIARVNAAYRRAYGRRATTDEVAQALAFFYRCDEALEKAVPDPKKREETAWQLYCQTLLASNEFIYVE